MKLFYNSDIDKNTKQISFDKIESKHLVKVLRKKEGDNIYVTNGKGQLFICRINTANYKKCLATVFGKHTKKKSHDYSLHIAIAPTKDNGRFEWFLEKAIEIGIDEITPIITQNSERRIIKKERFEKIIQSAMKQSLKYHLPLLNDLTNFEDFLKTKREEKKYIAHCNNGQKNLMKNVISEKESITILIGPEGDFSPSEVAKSLDTNWTPISLGNTRLRTETAAIVSIQNVAFINQ